MSKFTVKLPAMYTRKLDPPEHSFFCLGPRGTGKTTWLAQRFPRATRYDLLRTTTLLGLMRNPDRFRLEVAALPPSSWVVIDEVQKLPALLDEVHALLFEFGDKYRFALSGSSARKLRRSGSNLLAGRVVQRQFFPLSIAELGNDFDLARALAFGLLPYVWTHPRKAVATLEAYALTYLREEIQQEALVGSLDSFVRFLEIAGLVHGQMLNYSNVARDAGVARATVQRYFDVLADTLIGVSVPSWHAKARIKEVAHPKFYFFDSGVVRALQGRLRDPVESQERGPLLETVVLHELRAWMNAGDTSGTVCYWAVPSGGEIDFIWRRGTRSIGFEVKATPVWRRDYSATLRMLVGEKKLGAGYGIYTGDAVLNDDGITVLPLGEFATRLWSGKIFR
jgi:predicted AAA+ superfamily ATPase